MCLPAEKQTQYNLRQRAFLQLHLLLGADVGSAPLPCLLRGAGGPPNIPAIVPFVYSSQINLLDRDHLSLGHAERPVMRGSCHGPPSKSTVLFAYRSTLTGAIQLHCRLSQLQ